jgi:predicted Fe-Mo cluster-binding NifX family protein
VSDHGLSGVDRHTDISLALEQIGIPTLRHPVVWRRKPKAAVMVSGNGSVQVYLAPGTRRSERYSLTTIEQGRVPEIPQTIVRYLASLPGIAMVVAQDGPVVWLVSRTGRAKLEALEDDRIRYTPVSSDVLELGDAGTYADREWLQRTLDSAYPDAPTQLLQLFRSPRTGDLTVISKPGTDLRLDWEIPEHRSGHGSLFAEHMRCLVAADVRLSRPIRTVDLFPLILDYLGVAVPTGIDGVRPGSPEEAVA